jgi:hypothetical protein
MALQTVQGTNRTPGLDVSVAAFVAVDVGLNDKWQNTGREMVMVNNGSGAPITVTENLVATIDGQTPAGIVNTIPAGKTHLFGPFPTNAYNTPNLNQASLNFSSATSVSLLVFLPTQS